MTFSEKLVRLRRREGLSQEALSEALASATGYKPLGAGDCPAGRGEAPALCPVLWRQCGLAAG